MKTALRMNLIVRAVSAVMVALLVAPLSAEAQQAGKVYRVGVFWSPSGGGRLETLRQGLRELGYVEGQNLAIEQRFSEGLAEADKTAVAELVQRKVDVIVTSGSPATRAAKSATSTIPVVMTFVSDPVGQSFVDSLGRPGRNITGLTTLGSELLPKSLELLKEMAPKASRVGVLFSPTVQIHQILVKEMQGPAKAVGVELLLVEGAHWAGDVAAPLASLKKQRPSALFVLLPATTMNQKRILEFAAGERLPAVYWWREFVEAGGLMHYGPSVDEMYRRAASFVDKILKGAHPASLPVEQPMKVELVINQKTAKALGLPIPPSVLLRTDQLIQ